MPLDQPVFLSSARTVVRGACPHDCPGHLCALHVTVENGRAIKVEGDAGSSDDQRCAVHQGRALPRAHVFRRIACCIRCKRVGRRAKARFERIGWDEALRYHRRAASGRSPSSADGPQAIVPYSYAGTMGLLQYGSMDRRFFTSSGASLLDRTICSTAGKAGYVATIGAAIGTDLEQFENARLILIWGSNPIVSNLHLWSRVQEAKRRGAKLIAIDPYRSQTAEKCHAHLALLAGHRRRAGARHDARADRARTCSTATTSRATRSDSSSSQERVRDYPPQARRGRSPGFRPTSDRRSCARLRHDRARAAIRLNYGMQRHAGGGMAMRTAACLPALVGAWRDPAGGALLLLQRHLSGRTASALERPDLIWNNPRTINMSTIGDALLDAQRSADPRALRLQLEPGRGRAGVGQGRRAVSRARTSSASCTTFS